MNHSFRPAMRAYRATGRRLSSFAPAKASIWKAQAFAEKAVIGMTQEALSSLQTLGAQLRAKLLELPEYRALTVIERTIQELAEIMNPPAARSLDPVERPAPPTEASIVPPGAPQRPEVALSLAGGSQNRMAKAIADAIAAKAAPFSAPAAGAAHLGHLLNAAS
jgi:hypothetical protein